MCNLFSKSKSTTLKINLKIQLFKKTELHKLTTELVIKLNELGLNEIFDFKQPKSLLFQ